MTSGTYLDQCPMRPSERYTMAGRRVESRNNSITGITLTMAGLYKRVNRYNVLVGDYKFIFYIFYVLHRNWNFFSDGKELYIYFGYEEL